MTLTGHSAFLCPSEIMKTLILVLAAIAPVSAQQHLPAKRLGRSPAVLPAAVQGVANVRVLALRVQFKKETVDDLKTTGNGHFMLVPQDDPYADEGRTLDPLPHNRTYFEDQMLALRNYFLDASDSNLTIDYDVKPDGQDSAYTLDRFMRYYGDSFLSQSQRDLRLAELFRDAVRLADSTDTIDFSQYDHVIVFHAGAGQDFNTDDLTPDDVASRFVSLDLLRAWAGDPGFAGIPVNGGARVIPGGVLVPETESQEVIDALGFSVFTEIGLTGILASNFASQLGMPDMFNTETGTAGIGVFGLVDQGAVNGDGLIPVEPDPWTKIYMGWAQPVVMQNGTGISLLPKKLFGRSHILKIPINAAEYFLIENRQRDVVANALSPTTITRAIKDSNTTTGQVTFDTLYHAGAERASSGVITRVDEYDAGLPGTGLLIWHVNEDVVAQGLLSNSINNDILRRGVRVVEGSGSQEIGYRFTFGPFSVVDAGNDSDFFFFENDLFKRFNRTDSVFLTPTSIPSSLGYDRVNGGIHMTGISPRGWVMSFDLRTSLHQTGFPQFTGKPFRYNALNVGDVAGDSRPELIAVGVTGEIYVWSSDGQPVFANGITRADHRLGEDSTVYSVAVYAQDTDSIIVASAVADLDGDTKAEVITGSIAGRVVAWKGVDTDVNGFADTLFTYDTGARITAPIHITANSRIVVGDASGKLTVLTATGTPDRVLTLDGSVIGFASISADSLYWQTGSSSGIVELSTGISTTLRTGIQHASPFASVAVDLERSGQAILLDVTHDNGTAIDANGVEGQYPVRLVEDSRSPVSVADLDEDGFPEWIMGGDNKIYVFNHNGSLLTGFPVTIDPVKPVGSIESSILIADLDGDSKLDLLAACPDGRVFAYSAKGTLLAGFPLSAGSPISATPVIADLDQDGDIDIACAAEDGFVYVWDVPAAFQANRVIWGAYLRDPKRSGTFKDLLPLASPPIELIPAKSAYNYPNPARGPSTTIRYYLSEPANVKIRIFDMAGQHVRTLAGPGVALTDNEVTWTLGGIQSGVYFAKIHAVAVSGRRITRTVKIAVTR